MTDGGELVVASKVQTVQQLLGNETRDHCPASQSREEERTTCR